jgi:Flp pilus assembly pilin Flp
MEVKILRCAQNDSDCNGYEFSRKLSIKKGGILMWRKISNFPLIAYLAITGMPKELKRDERGLSGVVVAILLILIAVLTVVIIWGFLGGWLKELWDRIVGETAEIK